MGVRWNFPRSKKNEILSYRSLPKKAPYMGYYKILAKEVLTNSLLACYNEKFPVKVEFKSFKINPKDIPGYSAYKTVVELCMEYCDEDFDILGREHYKKILNLLNEPYIDSLRISNYNTISMQNNKNNIAISWREFLAKNGIKYKNSLPNINSIFLDLSDFNTIFISTKNKCGYEYSEGIASFTAYKMGDFITKGIGYYSNEDMPKLATTNLDVSFSRKEAGTDYYILAYNKDYDYKRDIVNIIIEEFEEKIKSKLLSVSIDDVDIDYTEINRIKNTTNEFLDNKLDIILDKNKDIIAKIDNINQKRGADIEEGIIEREITLLDYFKYKMRDGFKHLNEDHQKVYQMIIDNIEEVHKYRTSDGFSHVIGVSATTIDLILLKVGIGSYNRFYNYIIQIIRIDLKQGVNKM